MKNHFTARPLRSHALPHRKSRARFAPAHRMLGPRGELWTDRELLTLGGDTDVKYELWNGKVVSMPPAGIKHGVIIARLMAYLGIHVQQHKLGELMDGQTGFRLSVEDCFAPDISFVSRERLRLVQPVAEKLFHGAPDLAVEVLSPSDSIIKTERKLALYLNYGCRLAWLVDTRNKTVRVYRPGENFELLDSGRWLTGNSVVPNFRLSLAKLFEGI